MKAIHPNRVLLKSGRMLKRACRSFIGRFAFPSTRSKRGRNIRAGLSLAIGLLAFATMQLAIFLAMESRWPVLRDPEYAKRMSLLRSQIKNAGPDRELVLLVGSSRIACNLDTDQISSNKSGSLADPVVFNFGMVQATPYLQLMHLKRLYRDGIQPRVVVAELTPMFLSQRPVPDLTVDVKRLNRADLGHVLPYCVDPAKYGRNWRDAKWLPLVSYRDIWVNRIAPETLARERRIDDNWSTMTATGFLPHPSFAKSIPLATYQKISAKIVKNYGPGMHPFRVDELMDHSLRELGALVRQQGGALFFLVTPESQALRGVQDLDDERSFQAYIADLQRETSAGIIDSRAWLEDRWFFEGLHLTHAGAAEYARQFEAKALPTIRNGLRLAVR